MNVSINDFFNKLSTHEQVGDGINSFGVWYDWFCTDKATLAKGKSLVSKLRQIKDSKRFDNSKCYVFFKNNCPVSGSLYDDFRICDLESGRVLFTITPKSGHKSDHFRGNVWARMPDGTYEEVFHGDWKEIKKWFNEYEPESK